MSGLRHFSRLKRFFPAVKKSGTLNLTSRLRLESLDDRVVPALTFHPLSDYTMPGGKDLLVPLTAIDSDGYSVSFSALSDNSNLTASVLGSGPSLRLTVSGVDGQSNPFTGDIVLRLFPDIAPLAVNRITSLANSGWYNGKLFHRVINGFMAQGGSADGMGSGDSGLGRYRDEFHARTTFVSPGLVALANAGDDGNDSQFFITDIDVPLAQMPQHLNFNHSIVGLLVSGFDIFNQIMSTNVVAQNPPTNNELSRPIPNITIVNAEVFTDDQNGVLRISGPADFVGTAQITVTATSDGGEVQQTFTVTGTLDTINDRPFLGPIDDIRVSAGSSVTISLDATDLEDDLLTFLVGSPNDINTTPTSVHVRIDQVQRTVTLTPVSGFLGTIDLLAGVKDNFHGDYDTERFRLIVTNDIDLDEASDDGLYNDDNVTTDPSPTLTVRAEENRIVTVRVGGQNFTTTETVPGIYKVTLPEGILRVGPNIIEATVSDGTNTDELAPLTIVYAPNTYGIYTVPGVPGTPQQLALRMPVAESAFFSEVAYFVVDDPSGRIGSLLPGDAGYAAAAIQRAVSIFTARQGSGANQTLAVEGGQHLAFLLVQNSTLARLRAVNPSNSPNGPVQAFFSLKAANNDNFEHALINYDAVSGRMILGFEDLTGGGDRDYNDRVIAIRLVGDTGPMPALRAPGSPGHNVTLTATKMEVRRALTRPGTPATVGEVGLFLVDDPSGRIGHLNPGDPGYAQVALARRQLLFNPAAPTGTTNSFTLPGGSVIGFYVIESGSAASFLANNPNNNLSQAPRAYFSFTAANPDGVEHFRTVSPEQVTRTAPTGQTPLQIHAMVTPNGTSLHFDDLVFAIDFAAAASPAVPSINSVQLSPSPVRTNDLLTATVNASNPSGATLFYNYIWRVNGTIVASQITLNATNSLNLSQSGKGDKGQTISVEVTVTDGSTTSSPVTQSIVVANSLPTATVQFSPSPDIFNDSTITATVNGVDADGDSILYDYVWRHNGIVVRTLSDTSSTSDSLDLTTLTDVRPGDTISLLVTPKDPEGSGTPVTQSATIVNRDPQTVGVPDQSFGGPGLFSLDVSSFFSDPDGDALTYQATLADDSPLPGWLSFAGSTLQGNPPASDAGTLNIKVTVNDPSAATATSTFDLTLSNTPNSLNDPPVISSLQLSPENPTPSDTVTAFVTAFDAENDPVTFTYVWRINGNIVQTTTNASTSDYLDLSSHSLTGGEEVKVTVTPNDGMDDGTPVEASVFVVL
jgi:cyclophilin family peptidyl-prolyl cis-trans isomerase